MRSAYQLSPVASRIVEDVNIRPSGPSPCASAARGKWRLYQNAGTLVGSETWFHWAPTWAASPA
ncbi:MAG TPA: hypothetical protein VFQ61_20700, partial [Polyangiaceae bacterium]|nr:hypothetical protein [Polyangiaceae bacterium]